MDTGLISRIPLFAALPASDIQHLADTLRACEISEKTILFSEGGREDFFYILMDGQAEVIKALGTQDERLLGVREKGALIGEMSLFTPGSYHTASVRALTPLKLLQMTRADFDSLLHRQPTLAYEVVRMMSQRLEHSENSTILDLQEKNTQLTQAYHELKAAQAQIIEKEKLEHELQIARHIQLSILPQQLPQHARFDCGALMIPAQAVGGDFYDLIPLRGNCLGVVVGDVSDKGVPAALFMALTYSLLRAEAGRGASPGKTLKNVNRNLVEINSAGMFVTVLYGVLDYATREFSYARAGHPLPVIVDGAGRAIEVKTATGQPLGLFEDILLDEQRLVIPSGGAALVYSDGLSEAADAAGNQFGVERIPAVLSQALHLNAQGACNKLWEAVMEFSYPSKQQDDFTLVYLKPGAR
jgi:serine phosphatase RsbU (regulator of sigma subunit)